MRPHISLNVRNVADSVAFYEKVFGTQAQKQTVDYAKFDLTEPPLNFTLVGSKDRLSRVNHLGIEVADPESVLLWRKRIQERGLLAESVQENITCCFAKQDKVWFRDPDGNGWEIFHVHEQLPVEGSLASTGCCVAQDSKAKPGAKTEAACACG